MKNKILLFVVAFAALFTISTHAAPVKPQTPSLLSVIPAATRTNLATPLWIEAPGQLKVAVQTDITSASVASNLTYYFAPSVDGSTYDTNSPQMFVWTPTIQAGVWGTNTYVTNITVDGYAGYFLVGVSNGHATASVTNVLKYGVKKQW